MYYIIKPEDGGFVFPTISPSGVNEGMEIPILPSEYELNRRGGFVENRIRTMASRYNQSLYEKKEELEKYVGFCNKINKNFHHLFLDYDTEVVLSNTCALSFTKPSHSDLEYLGKLDPDNRSDFEYDQSLFDCILRHYKRYLTKPATPNLSFPRGKNLGYPHPISGRRRGLTDILLALHVSLTLAGWKQGMRLSDLTSFLESLHGPDFLLYSERYQMSKKSQPMRLLEGDFYSENFEPRVRGIYMSSKYKVAWNRPFVKDALGTILNSPNHVQDRATISKNISIYMDQKHFDVFPLDVSAFDQAHGGSRGRQLLKFGCELHPTYSNYDDLNHELSSPLMTFTRDGAYDISTVPILPSGASFTTVVGCYGSTFISYHIASSVMNIPYDKIDQEFGKRFFFMNWGDDMLIFFSKDLKVKEQDILDSLSNIKIKADFEPVIKYLGSVYARGQFSGSLISGYATGRAIQTSFFPERKKEYPFTTIGYLARLELMSDGVSRQFHEAMMNMWDDEKLGNPFPYTKRNDVLLSLLPEMQKYSDKISQIDDVLNLFTHGVSDFVEGNSAFDESMGIFHEFLGLSNVDVSDPSRFLKDLDEKINPAIIEMIKEVQDGNFDAYVPTMNLLVEDFKLTWHRGDVLY